MTFNPGLLPISAPTAPYSSPQIPNPSQTLIREILGELHSSFLSSEDLDQTLANLPNDERRRFEEAVPPTLWRELKSLSKESDVEILEENLLLLADRIESRENVQLADSICRVLANHGSTERIREAAKMQVLANTGHGNFKNSAQYCLERFTKELFNPVNIATTIAGVGAFRAVRYGVGLKLAGNIRKLPIGYNAVSSLLGWTAASSAATLAEKLTRSTLTGSWKDWSGRSLVHDLAVNALTYSSVLLSAKVFSLSKVNNNGMASKFGMAFGAYFGAVFLMNAEEKLGLHPPIGATGDHPYTDAFVDYAVLTAHFLLARRLSTALGGKNFVDREATMFGRGIFTPANF